VYGKLLHQHEVFRLNFSEGFLRELAVKVQEKRVNPEEHIYKQDDAPERLFFLLKGSGTSLRA
jgi:CRP-like cAMP-binding protein